MTLNNIHQDLITITDRVYKPCGFHYTTPIAEAESSEYGACIFSLNARNIRFRVAKITPTKTGQFVTLWKRSSEGITQPYDATDPVDFFVISARKDEYFGQFIFPKSILCEKNVFSTNGKGGNTFFSHIAKTEQTIVFYESTHRILKTMDTLKYVYAHITQW